MNRLTLATIFISTLSLAGCKPQLQTEQVAPIENPEMVAAPIDSPPPELIKSDVLFVKQESEAEAYIRQMALEYKVKSKALREGAEKIHGEYFYLGTAYNEIDFHEHSCFILGNLLDKKLHVINLAHNYVPDYSLTTEDNVQALSENAQSLDNFVGSARRILHLSMGERIIEWNLDCVGKFDIPNSAIIDQAGLSTFYKVDNGVLKVLGDIEPGYAQNIINAIEKNPKVEVIALGSGGGLISEAMQAGIYIRKKNLQTTLWNNCYSACPFVFMGGVKREIWSPYPALGFHQAYDKNGNAFPKDSQLYNVIFKYLMVMGVEPQFVIEQMWSSPPQNMTQINGSDESLCNANVVTWSQRSCTGPGYSQTE